MSPGNQQVSEAVLHAIVPTERSDATGLAAGHTPGRFAVSEDGGATYSIPLWVPPGRAGMQPDLGLAYHSRAGNGPLGVGWRLSGLSRIVRVPKTIASDGRPGPVRFDAEDRFKLDDDLLVPVALDTHGFAAEYRPEPRPFAKVLVDGFDELGPTAFTVFAEDGRVLHYGRDGATIAGNRLRWSADAETRAPASLDSSERVRYAWLLSSVEDRSGNGMSVQYQDPDPDCRAFPDGCLLYERQPLSIVYASHAGVAGRRKVAFVWSADRPDHECGFVAGFGLRAHGLLKRIEMWAPNPVETELVRSYHLTYVHELHDDPTAWPSPSGRSLLAAVEERDGAGVARAATRFEWTRWDQTFDEVDTSVAEPATPHPAHFQLIVADLNGDGLDDLLYRKSVGRRTVERPWAPYGDTDWEDLGWFYRLGTGTGSGFGPERPTSLPADGDWSTVPLFAARALDIDGDGRAEVAVPIHPSYEDTMTVSTHVRLYKFAAGDFHAIDPPGEATETAGIRTWWIAGGGLSAVDLDGVGRPHLVRFYDTADKKAAWRLRRNDGGTLTASYEDLAVDLGAGPQPSWVRSLESYVADLDGTGRSSFLIQALKGSAPATAKPTSRLVALARGPAGLTATPTTLLAGGVEESGFRWLFVDLTGDGLADAIGIPIKGGRPSLSINTGAGFPEPWAALGGLDATWAALSFGPGDSGLRVMPSFADAGPALLVTGRDRTRCAELGLSPVVHVVRPTYRKLVHGLEFKLEWPIVARSGPGGIVLDQPPAFDFDDPALALSQVLDSTGRGLGDFLQLVEHDGRRTLHLFRRTGTRGDLLSAVEDGLGARVGISYEAVVGRSADGPEPAYPLRDLARGLWVVSEYRVDRGLAPGQTKAYGVTYSGQRFDLHGRGFLGFSRRIVQETETGLRWTTDYDNAMRVGTAYPLARLPKQERFEAALPSGGKVIDTVTTDYDLRGSAATGGPYSVVVRQVDRVQEEEPFGVTVRMRTVLDYDAFDNLHEQTVHALGEGSVLKRTVEYHTDPTRWLLGLPWKVTETATGADGTSEVRTTRLDHDPDTGLLSAVTREPDGDADLYSLTRLERTAEGLVKAIEQHDRAGAVRRWEIAHDAAEGMFETDVRSTLGLAFTLAHHPALGLVAERTDSAGVVTRWQYDGFGRPRAEMPSDGPALALHYSKHPEQGYRLDASRPGHGRWELTFDRLGRLTRRTTLAADGRAAQVLVGYDWSHLDRVAIIHGPFFGGDVQVPATATRYDVVGRVVRRETRDGPAFAFDHAGLRTTVRDAAGRESYALRDELGRTIESGAVTTMPGTGLTREIATRFTYSPWGALAKATDPRGHVSTISHDRLGRRTGLSDPDAGAWTFRHTGFDDLRSEIDPFGATTTYFRDAFGRTTGHKRSDGLDAVDYAAGGGVATLSADGVGWMVGYDASRRPRRWTCTVGERELAVEVDYDVFARPEVLRYPLVEGVPGLVLRLGYAATGDLERIGDEATGSTLWRALERDARGRVTRERFGNGLVTVRRYDPMTGSLTRIDTAKPGKPQVQALAYSYNADGTLERRIDELLAAASRGREQRFGYDDIGRLSSWGQSSWSVGYHYDDLDNLVRRVPSFDAAETFVPGGTAGPHAVTGGTLGPFAYDARGRQTSGSGRAMTYSSDGLVRTIGRDGSSLHLRYDFAGHRVVKQGPRGTSIYVGDLYEQRLRGATTLHLLKIRSSERTVAEVIIRQHPGDPLVRGVHYLHDDHLGSIQAVTDESGDAIETASFDPFGNRVDRADPTVAAASASDLHPGFAGHEEDDEVGLVNMRARLYDPRLGRFLTPDLIVANPFDGRSYNRYAYVRNDPLNRIDPTGLEDVPLPGAGAPSGPPAGGWGGGLLIPEAAAKASDVLARWLGWHNQCLGPVSCIDVSAASRPHPAASRFTLGGIPQLVTLDGDVRIDFASLNAVQFMTIGRTPDPYSLDVRRYQWGGGQFEGFRRALVNSGLGIVAGLQSILTLGGDNSMGHLFEPPPVDPQQADLYGRYSAILLVASLLGPPAPTGTSTALFGESRPVGLTLGSGRGYSVVAEVRIPQVSGPLGTRASHNVLANTGLLQQMAADTEVARAVNAANMELGGEPHVEGYLLRMNSEGKVTVGSGQPPGLTWHHHESAGVMQLVVKDQHVQLSRLFHADGRGGFSIWGGRF
jgi:RHS repeat-associated protein